jgi:hypothetical protein
MSELTRILQLASIGDAATRRTRPANTSALSPTGGARCSSSSGSAYERGMLENVQNTVIPSVIKITHVVVVVVVVVVVLVVVAVVVGLLVVVVVPVVDAVVVVVEEPPFYIIKK